MDGEHSHRQSCEGTGERDFCLQKQRPLLFSWHPVSPAAWLAAAPGSSPQETGQTAKGNTTGCRAERSCSYQQAAILQIWWQTDIMTGGTSSVNCYTVVSLQDFIANLHLKLSVYSLQ